MNAWRLLSPAAILTVGALALPVTMPRPRSTVSDEQCLTLGDSPPAPVSTEVIATFERCIAVYPNDVQLLADLGALSEAGGDFAQAENIWYQRALGVDPDYADLRLRLGRLLLRRGAAPDARREAAAGLRVQPNRQALLELQHDADARLAGADH